MSPSERQYELVLLGATGYTGKYCVEHIVTKLPTNLRWAVAGRNASKLANVLQEIKSLNHDRIAPGLEVASLSLEDLDALTKKTKCLVTTVGPFHLYGSLVVEACARNGTHYVDCTGESPWVLDMIRHHHDTATANKAIMIPQCGVESCPSDIITWKLVQLIREKLSARVKNVIANVTLATLPSGGTLATVFSIFDHYSTRQIIQSTSPFALSTVPGRKATPEPLSTRLTGVRYVPDLGTLTTGLASGLNATVVHRSWSLFDKGRFYGPNFQYNEYQPTRNIFTGFLIHLAITFGMAALAIPPARWLVRKFVHQPGQGPTREDTLNDHLEWKVIAVADSESTQRAKARLRFDGSAYHMTAILIIEAAITILRDQTEAHKIAGGIITPATLGQAYIDRLEKAGVKLETKMLDH